MIKAVANSSGAAFLDVYWDWPLTLVYKLHHCILFDEGIAVKRVWAGRKRSSADRVSTKDLFKLKA